MAYEFLTKTALTDSTCLPYRGMDNSNWAETDCSERMCRNSDRFGNVAFVPSNQSLGVKVAEYGQVLGVEAMKAEIAARGPIACSMWAHSDLFEKYTGGVITDRTKYPGTTHVINVVGWGREEAQGLSYWIVRNSFGTNWGELGYYRAEMGANIYNMESHNCSWAVPDPAATSALRRRSARPGPGR